MVELSSQSKGAIAEHYVIMRLLARGYIASNINFTVKNSKWADILCSKDAFGALIPIQVKSSFNNARSFNIGMTHGDFCTNGVFDDAKALRSLKEKIVCPWIFVNVDNTSDKPTFRTFILSKDQVIKLAFESEKWYINDVRHKKPLQPGGTVAITLRWLEGLDTEEKKARAYQHGRFSNPFTPKEFEEAWHNLGLD